MTEKQEQEQQQSKEQRRHNKEMDVQRYYGAINTLMGGVVEALRAFDVLKKHLNDGTNLEEAQEIVQSNSDFLLHCLLEGWDVYSEAQKLTKSSPFTSNTGWV